MGGPRARPPWAPARALPAEVPVHVQTWLRRYPWLPNYIMCIHNIIIWSVLMTSKSQTFYSSIWCRVHSCLQLLILHRCFVGKLRRALWVANGAISLAVIQCVITHLFWHFIYAAVAIYPSFTTLRLAAKYQHDLVLMRCREVEHRSITTCVCMASLLQLIKAWCNILQSPKKYLTYDYIASMKLP